MTCYFVDNKSIVQIFRPIQVEEINAQCEPREILKPLTKQNSITKNRISKSGGFDNNTCSFYQIDEDETDKQSSPIILNNRQHIKSEFSWD